MEGFRQWSWPVNTKEHCAYYQPPQLLWEHHLQSQNMNAGTQPANRKIQIRVDNQERHCLH